MQRITLDKIRISLQDLVYKVEVDPGVAERARLAVQRMLALGDARD
jgi:quinolinate synthase